jgi:uncharacterized protein YqgQ
MQILHEANQLAKSFGFLPHSKVYDVILFMRDEYTKAYVPRHMYDKAMVCNKKYLEELKVLRKQVSTTKTQLKLLGITPDKKCFGDNKPEIILGQRYNGEMQ